MSARNKQIGKTRRHGERAERKALFAATRNRATYGAVNALYRAFWGI